jgi:hypothetical protein
MNRRWLFLCAAMLASLPRLGLAQEAPSAPGVDARYEELLKRQRQLEDQLRAQQALLEALRQSASLPEPGKTPELERFRIINPELPPDDPDRTAPLAGYDGRNFFVRDRRSWFVFIPKGRINVDWYNFLNRPHPPSGVAPNSAQDPRASLRDGVFIRRARIGIAGTVARHIDFRVEADFASLPQPGQYATLAEASVNVDVRPWLRFEAGQFYIPLTLENETSENFTDFLEKSTVVRFVVPQPRDLGAQVFGTGPSNSFRYWVGVFNGDGQNFKNLDNQPAVIGRAFLAPLAFWPAHPQWLEYLWAGGSFWWQRSDNLGGAGPPSVTGATSGDLQPITTTGGFSIFSSNYANGTDITKSPIRSHLAPDGTTLKWALELNVPIWRRYCGVRSEYVHQSIDVREYNDLNAAAGNFVRNSGSKGLLDGWGAYVEAWAWIGGNVHPDYPGLYEPPHWRGYSPPPPPVWALQLAARYEHIEMDITGLAPSMNAMGAVVPDPADGHYALDTFELGANFWVTRHSRIMTNYLMNYVGAGEPSASAPNEKKNLFYKQWEYELLFRLQVNI